MRLEGLHTESLFTVTVAVAFSLTNEAVLNPVNKYGCVVMLEQ